MGILGIENRTENWKTVEHFYGLSDDAKVKLVTELLGEKPDVQAKDIQIELFWQGMRDYRDWLKKNNLPDLEAASISQIFDGLFPCLKEKVANFRSQTRPYKFESLKPHNYDTSVENNSALLSNLTLTEIDIVIQTSKTLFIGEAKQESKLNGTGKRVLVHQLIRQYVMATLIVSIIPECQIEKVVPFVVWDSDSSIDLKNTVQVKFMDEQGWLRPENILTWNYIEKLLNPDSA